MSGSRHMWAALPLVAHDRCLAKHAVGIDVSTLGRELLVALYALGREMSVAEFRSRPDTVLSATGSKSRRPLRKARGLVWVSQVTPEADIRITPLRDNAPNVIAMNEEQVSLPRDVADMELGRCVAQQLV